MSSFKSPKMWKSQGESSELYRGCCVFQLIPHQIGSMGTAVVMQKDDSVRQHSRAFWLYGGSLHPQPPRNEPHLSVLLCLPPFPMLDEHTLHYAHLQSSKETTVWTPAFSLCISLTLQKALSIRNNSVASFFEEGVLWRVFSFHLNAPYRIPLNILKVRLFVDYFVLIKRYSKLRRIIHAPIFTLKSLQKEIIKI